MNTKKAQKLTKIIMLSVLIFAVIYDIIIAIIADNATISEITLKSSFLAGCVPYMIGYLCSHLFWPSKKELKIWISMLMLFIPAFLIFIIQYKILNVKVMPMIYVIIGIPFGKIFWAQKKES